MAVFEGLNQPGLVVARSKEQHRSYLASRGINELAVYDPRIIDLLTFKLELPICITINLAQTPPLILGSAKHSQIARITRRKVPIAHLLPPF